MNDQRQLRDFVERGSQAAFSNLSKRHMGLVYSTCQRELGDGDLAQDATQAVFLLLAQKAKPLSRHPNLPAWLFHASRLVAKNIRKMEQRRKRMEQAMIDEARKNDSLNAPEWTTVDPLLNDALAALKARERDAILLRFFEGRTMSDTGAVLGLSEEGARRRVERGLEKMHGYFKRHDVAVSVSALSLLLAAHAAKAVPAGCAAAVNTLSASAVAGTAALAYAHPHIARIAQEAIRSMKIASIKTAAAIGAASIIVGSVAQHMASGAHTNARKPVISDQNHSGAGIDPQALSLLNKVQHAYAQTKGLTEECDIYFMPVGRSDKPEFKSSDRMQSWSIRLMHPNLAYATQHLGQVHAGDQTGSDGAVEWEYYPIANFGFESNGNPISHPGYSKKPLNPRLNLETPGANLFFNIYQALRNQIKPYYLYPKIQNESKPDYDLRRIKYSGKEVMEGVSYDVLSFSDSMYSDPKNIKQENTSYKLYIGSDNFIHICMDISKSRVRGNMSTNVPTYAFEVFRNIKAEPAMNANSFHFTPPPGAFDLNAPEPAPNAGEDN